MNNKGYTLIELLVTISIVTILFAVGLAGYRDFGRRQELQGAVKLVQGDLRKAQQMALSGIKPEDSKCNSPQVLLGYNFRVNTSGESYYIQASCSGGYVKVGETIYLPSGITMSILSAPLTFKVLAAGTNVTSSNIITLSQTATGATTTITIGAGGDIK